MNEFFNVHGKTLLYLLGLNIFITIMQYAVINIKNDPNRLRREGLQDEYIEFYKKIQTKVLNLFIFPFLIIQLVLLVIEGLFFPDFSSMDILVSVFIGGFILYLPIGLIFYGRHRNKYKDVYREIAVKTGSEIVIDFKYKALRMFFNPVIEIPASILLIIYIILHYEFRPAIMLSLYIFVPWFNYFNSKTIKNLNKILFKREYTIVYYGVMAYHIILILLLFLYTFDSNFILTTYDYVFFTVLVVLQTLKVIYYLSNYPKFRKEIRKLSTTN